jgi:hypothetical protein
MTLQKLNTRNIVLALIVILMAIFRLLTFKYQSWSNFTPVGAVAIFSGVYFTDKWKAYAIILLTFVVSDVIINHAYTGVWSFWSAYTFWNCVCFSIIVFIGSVIKKINFASALLIILAPVMIHWLIMDLPWVNGTLYLYPKTLAGYGAALVAAIPFERNMLFGDLLFGAVLFGGFELAKTKYSSLRSTVKLAILKKN